MTKLLKYTILLMCVAFTGKAQDIHFTQFYAVPMYLNPAFAGVEKCTKFSFAARNQWTGISKAYATYLFSYDGSIPKINSGIGFMAATDYAGSGPLKTTMANLNYAYEALISREISLRFGAQAGFQQKSINYNHFIFGDQIARGGNVPSVEIAPSQKTFLDISSGILLYTRKYWFGASVNHLNKPNESLSGQKSILPMKTSVHTGFRIKLNDPPRKEDTKYIIPAINYMHQNKFNQASFGMYYVINALNFGIWYRGIPFINDKQNGYSTNDAFSLLFAFSSRRFHFGYSYDVTVSKLWANSGGAHEVVTYYKICRKKKKRYSVKMAPCPMF